MHSRPDSVRRRAGNLIARGLLSRARIVQQERRMSAAAKKRLDRAHRVATRALEDLHHNIHFMVKSKVKSITGYTGKNGSAGKVKDITHDTVHFLLEGIMAEHEHRGKGEHHANIVLAQRLAKHEMGPIINTAVSKAVKIGNQPVKS